MDVKQVIVMRRDLGMRRGKEIAQGAHAALAWLVARTAPVPGELAGRQPVFSELEREWLQERATKVCVRVDSEAELLEIYEQARAAGVEAHLITDSGRTEFHGVPTRTCCALGPELAERLDEITGHLKLL